jgi:hypothetical protein
VFDEDAASQAGFKRFLPRSPFGIPLGDHGEMRMAISSKRHAMGALATSLGLLLLPHVAHADSYGAGTFVWLPTVAESSIGGGAKFSNFGYTSPTDLLFGSVDNGATLDAISGDRSVDLRTFEPNLLCVGAACIGTASGHATADLSTGTLKVFSASSGSFTSAQGDQLPGVLARSQAAFEDTLTALAPGKLNFDLDLSGFLAGQAGGGVQLWLYKNGTSLVTNGIGAARPVISTQGEVTGVGNCFDPDPGGAVTCHVDATDFSRLNVDVDTGDTVDFVMVLEADAFADGTSDYSHTLNFGVTGVGFNSASGVFLSAAAQAPAPEPSTWAIFIAGFLGVGSVLRRSRAKGGLVTP